MKARLHSGPRAGLTLIELVLATGLLTLLLVAVFSMLESCLDLWRKSEVRRNLTEQATGVMELLVKDLRALDPGEGGDLLVEWVRFDTDGDELRETGFPRLRLVRQASASEVARLQVGVPEPFEGPALLEVCYAVVPAGKERDQRAEGVLYRGAQLRTLGGGFSYFDPGFFRSDGRPVGPELDEVTGGLLWLDLQLATQTSIVYDGWKLGDGLEHAATSWDAWARGRPDGGAHPWNEPGAGMPTVKDDPLLPRRVRVVLEFERADDRRYRTRLVSFVGASDGVVEVDDPERLPTGSDPHIRIDGEWLRVSAVHGRRVTVKRAQRGSEPATHLPGAMVHYGQRLVREAPIDLYREDWNL